MAEAGEKERLAPTRTELVWPGKRTQVERVALPFQVVETINQSRATREQTPMLAGLPPPPLFEGKSTADTSWKNKLIWGENKYVMASLLQGDPSIGLEPLAGKVNLIYIDPPFATGQDFSYRARVGDEEWLKEASIIEETAYRDTWGRGLESYLQMMYERLVLMRELLAEDGSIYVHMDDHMGHYLKAVLDEVFGQENFVNEIVWKKYAGVKNQARLKFTTQTDSIYLYTKVGQHIFNQMYRQMTKAYITGEYKYVDEEGRRYALLRGRRYQQTGEHRKRYLDEMKGAPVTSLWDDDGLQLNTSTAERLGFDTQKPESLLDRIIRVSSNPGDLVADFFCGSGTTQAVAEKLGRRWIGCDLSRFAIQVTRKRMLEIRACQPFQVLNLGRYERQHWQVNVLNGRQEDGSKAVADYLRFIVALYHLSYLGSHDGLLGFDVEF